MNGVNDKLYSVLPRKEFFSLNNYYKVSRVILKKLNLIFNIEHGVKVRFFL